MKTKFFLEPSVWLTPIFVLLLGATSLHAECIPLFRRADSNSDGRVDLSDAIATLGYLYLGTGIPSCLDAADANDTGAIDLSDGVYTVLYLFTGGAAPPAPGPAECGLDPTDDDLACVAGAPCAQEPGGETGEEVCDGVDNDCDGVIDCPKGFFCSTPPGDCRGAATCAVRPDACLAVFKPVCGCDGVTYSNACHAAGAGVGVAHEGACDCTANDECPREAFCAKEVGACDGKGTCSLRPDFCPDIFDPVCGCDGATYPNSCSAAMNGVNVDHPGECTVVKCKGNDECAEGSFCAKSPGNCDGLGDCKERPVGCPKNLDPVCGCDGITYDNDCLAAEAGVNVAHDGECLAVE